LIRHLDVDIRLDNSDPPDEYTLSFEAYVADYVRMLCDIILRAEVGLIELTLSLTAFDCSCNYGDPRLEAYKEIVALLNRLGRDGLTAYTHLNLIFPEMDRFTVEMGKLWRRHVEHTSFVSRFDENPEEWDKWVSEELVNENLLRVVASMEIGVGFVTPKLFTLLQSTRILTLHHCGAYVDWDDDDFQSLAETIIKLPSLETLELNGVMLPKFPLDLFELSCIEEPSDDDEDGEITGYDVVHTASFWQDLFAMRNLESLDLQFCETIPAIRWDPSVASPLVPNGGFGFGAEPKFRFTLREFVVKAVTGTEMLNQFCSEMLAICDNLDTVRLYGVEITKESLRRTSTRQLNSFILGWEQGENNELHRSIEWSDITHICERNADLEEIKICRELISERMNYDHMKGLATANLRLTSLTIWSTSCPIEQLDAIEYVVERQVEEHDKIVWSVSVDVIRERLNQARLQEDGQAVAVIGM
jgi:hypothetical protein